MRNNSSPREEEVWVYPLATTTSQYRNKQLNCNEPLTPK